MKTIKEPSERVFLMGLTTSPLIVNCTVPPAVLAWITTVLVN